VIVAGIVLCVVALELWLGMALGRLLRRLSS